MRCNSLTAVLALGLILMTLVNQCYGQLQVNYYLGKCHEHDVEEIIYNVIAKHFKKDQHVVSDLVRLLFHDCVVRMNFIKNVLRNKLEGCDASLLLDGQKSEKTSEPNLSLGGFDVLDAAKEAVEKVCPGIVSCADILTIATRASVFLAGGKWYDVETGRRDGLISREAEATAILPAADIKVNDALKLFDSMKLNKEDFVILLGGGHTIGTAHCENFEDRVFNYRNTSRPDRRLRPSFLKYLRETCPTQTKVNNETFLDQTPRSHFKIDNGYYKQILANKALLGVDANLASSKRTQPLVQKLALNRHYFLNKFGPAMVKMSRYQVLTRNEGEIRKSCRAVNKK